MSSTVVIGYTSRPESRAALAHAIEQARLRNGTLHIVRTVGENVHESPSRARDWAEKLAAAETEGAELVAEATRHGVIARFHLESSSNDAAGQLLDYTRRVEADLLVVGIRRRSPVGKLVLGSVSQDILLGAECPVLAVKAPNGD